MRATFKIGTRGSRLALWQAQWVRSAIRRINPSLLIEIITIKTQGDKILDTPLAMVGGKGLFVKEIEEALIDRRIDLAVHSLKDMPADIPPGLCIGPIPERGNPYDVLISRSGRPLAQLRNGARVGTSSLRRAAQLLHQRPDITILPLRGNLDTRIRKLETEDIDAIVLAAAGLKRLNLENKITEYLDDTVMLPAVGQGALCIELRKEDTRTAAALADLNHPETQAVVMGERAFLNRLEGGCQVPIAAHGHMENGAFSLQGLVANLDGTAIVRDTFSGPAAEFEKIGITLAERLLSMGAKEILDELKVNEHGTTQR
jgi:hydroxymethylbilane synthase